jgi:hypothetical protein
MKTNVISVIFVHIRSIFISVHPRCIAGGNTMKHMVHLVAAMHRVLAISPAFDYSLIDSVLSSGQETSSSTMSTHMMGRQILKSG